MNNHQLRVAFAGTPEFSVNALAAIFDAKFCVPLVLTQPDRPAGRGLKLKASPVKVLAESLNIPVEQTPSFNKNGQHKSLASAAYERLNSLNIDVLVVAAYGLILPEYLLNLPALGCINIHASLLPRWRGAAPIQRALQAGDLKSGITIMKMDAGLDTGPIIDMASINIDERETAGSLQDKLAELGAAMIVKTLNCLANENELTLRSQPREGVLYAQKISSQDKLINWLSSAEKIDRQIRSLNPFTSAITYFNGSLIKLWQAYPVKFDTPEFCEPGEILSVSNKSIIVACGKQCLSIEMLQRPGSKIMKVDEFIKGFPISENQHFDVNP